MVSIFQTKRQPSSGSASGYAGHGDCLEEQDGLSSRQFLGWAAGHLAQGSCMLVFMRRLFTFVCQTGLLGLCAMVTGTELFSVKSEVEGWLCKVYSAEHSPLLF